MPRRWQPVPAAFTRTILTEPAPPSELDVLRAAQRSTEIENAALKRELHLVREELQLRQTDFRKASRDATDAASRIADLSRRLDAEQGRASKLERMFHACVQEFRKLEVTATELARLAGASPADVERLRAEAKTTCSDPDHAAVGLDRSAPDFLVRAARTAYRKANHPDTQPASKKPAAEAAFKRSEATFDRLFRMRGLQP